MVYNKIITNNNTLYVRKYKCYYTLELKNQNKRQTLLVSQDLNRIEESISEILQEV